MVDHPVAVKFCGLTRPQDAELAVELGARYCGVIFAGGPRLLTPARAQAVLASVNGTGVARVGVFGVQDADSILQIADETALDVLQLSRSVDAAQLVRLRMQFDGLVWGVAHTQPSVPRAEADPAFWFDIGADAVVLDAAVEGQLGGTGVALDWAALAPDVARLRARGRVVLAGGLRPENVARAIALASPDVVDVSSGVESTPGIKDPERMRAFARAAHAHEVR